MKKNILIAAIISLSLTGVQAIAKENIGFMGKKPAKQTGGPKAGAAGCEPGNGRTDLDVNNVRTLILTGGDMWWDLNSNPRYEVPKGSNKHSSFASSLWIGGIDNGGNLKVAAQTYRQTGNDMWPGALDTTSASITAEQCLAYDKHWKVERAEIENYVLNDGPMPDVVATWPGNGNPDQNQGRFLAPFYDANGDGNYDYLAGDYPGFNLGSGSNCDGNFLLGDQVLWWVFNDKGNIHTETGGFPIGLEIRAQAFAYATNNSLNNNTFYKYEIINRSTFAVQDCYFGQWIDSDIGFYADDYVGCDVGRGLGFTYNGNAIDPGVAGYGANPPAFGLDFFEGPFKDADGIDNSGDPCVEPEAINGLGFGDGIIDNERMGMTKYVFYNNNFTITGNPENAQHIYNYLRGRWKDGTPIIYGGNGYGAGIRTNFMFPGDSDPLGVGQFLKTEGVGSCNPLTPWDEVTSGNTPFDRRFLQSAGPFELKPGARNFITVGALWARASQGGNLASVSLIKVVDDEAQNLFNNCFGILNGPDAPLADVAELDREIVLNLQADTSILNYSETTLISNVGSVTYKFQGYMIYQLKDLTVTVADLKDLDRARLVAQCDVRDSISQIVNRVFDDAIQQKVPVLEVNGEDQGLRHSFRISTDAFAQGDNRMVNHKKYYFLIISYGSAQNNSPNFDTPFLAGRRTKGFSSTRLYTVIPHINSPELGGTQLNASYGDGPKLTRIEGWGNNWNSVDLTDETVNEILQAPYWAKNPTYQNGRGPVDIKVVNPLKVPKGEFEIRFTNTFTPSASNTRDTTRWILSKLDENGNPESSVMAINPLEQGFEQVIGDWGLSVLARRTYDPGDVLSFGFGNGYIESSIKFQDDSKRWITFMSDIDGPFELNWIRAGSETFTGPGQAIFDDYRAGDNFIDPQGIYERILESGFAPYRLASFTGAGPGYSSTATVLANMRDLVGVDIVLTPDKSKWSRCPVFETDSSQFSAGGAAKGDLRRSPSVDKDGNPDGTGNGFGWFPGYAINVETGERLNIAFGESSRLVEDRGRDMLFNPSSRIFTQNQGVNWIFGGRHYIYVFGSQGTGNAIMPRYDEGNFIRERMSDPQSSAYVANKRNIWRNCIWTGIPLNVPSQQFLSNECKIRIRVSKPYRKNYNNSEVAAEPVNNNNPLYRFNTNDLFTDRARMDVAKSALDIINVVPNPYYAYSGYEINQIDNRVKIINLPQKCKIRIYTPSGVLVRTYNKDERSTSLDWDLKNQSGIPISSGIYILHIDAGEIGEKVVKWLGVMRPIDLDTF